MGEHYQPDFDATFDFPAKLFKHRFGFGIDFGCSIIKVVYTTVEDENIRIHTVNFARQLAGEAIQFLKTKCNGNLKPGGSYHTGGVGVGEHLEEIEGALNIKCKISSEFIHMLTAFKFFSEHQSWENFVYPACTQNRKSAEDLAKTFEEFLPSTFPPEEWERFPFIEDHPATPTKVQYPILIAQVGSGHYLMRIESDKKSKFLDHYAIAGRTLLGLGPLLTGAKSYSEIMTLAAKGNPIELNQTIAEAGASDADEVYKAANACPIRLFSFGMAAQDKNKGDPKKEDIAAALRSMISNSVAQDAFNWSMLENVHQVFFVGGVVANDEIIRTEIEHDFMIKNHANVKRHACDCLFVRAGGHLSAFGSVLSNLEIL